MKPEFSLSDPLMRELYGQHLYEYLLVAQPDSVVHEKVIAEKQLLTGQFRPADASEIRPHITIAHFLAKESMEDTLIRWIQRICSQQESFTVTLNNYGGFPPDSIYLRVQNDGPFQKLAKELTVLNAYVRSCACPPVTTISRPYLNLASGIPGAMYFKALSHYSHQTFHESFAVSELQLLKRKRHFEDCKRINVFGLQPEGNSVFN